MIFPITYTLEKMNDCGGDCYTAESEKNHVLKLHILKASGSLKFSDLKA